MKPLLIASLAVLAAASASVATADQWRARSEPPRTDRTAEPGQCMGRVRLPPRFETERRQVLDAPENDVRQVTPAIVETSWRKVLIRPARRERIPTAPLYRIEYSSVVSPGPSRWVRSPPRYIVRADRVVASRGAWVWERRYAPVTSGAARPGQTMVTPTGEILCKVWRPGRYETLTRRIQIAPARRDLVTTMLRRRIAHRVLVRPAGVWIHDIPAEYRNVAVGRVIRPERVRWVRTPARYRFVEERRWSNGGEGWAPVVCGGPLTRSAMQQLQSALIERGYDPGPADGYGRRQSFDALRRFQMDHGMAAGQITVESARALGVID